jgi:hypothetical protein
MSIVEFGTQAQNILTLVGIGWGCAVLAANVGARAWRHLQLNPLPYRGPLKTVVAFFASMITGLVIPYIGFQRVQMGGQVALETIIAGAFIVAVVFAVSDIDKVQSFVVAGSEVRA